MEKEIFYMVENVTISSEAIKNPSKPLSLSSRFC